MILLSFYEFESRFQHLPRSANRHVRSQPPHSWRVAILPLIGQASLYKEYQFDQPWDSEQNLKVAQKMPDIFRGTEDEPNSTSFTMLVGAGAFDSSTAPPRLADITDGTSNTIALIQSAKAVPWTKPEDVVYQADGPVTQLSRSRLVGMADGTTRELPQDITDGDFRALITRSGGEPSRY